MKQPEDQARENIDRMLTKSEWAVGDQNDADISAYRGLAIRNFTLKEGQSEICVKSLMGPREYGKR